MQVHVYMSVGTVTVSRHESRTVSLPSVRRAYLLSVLCSVATSLAFQPLISTLQKCKPDSFTMAAAVMRTYFGSYFMSSDSTKGHDESTRTTKALPAEWYTSAEMFGLEQRAIFSKKWLLVTHRQRIPIVGDSMQATIAGRILLILHDTDDQIVARHSAPDDVADARSAHVHIDRMGFVWINLDTADPPQHRWSSDHANTDHQERLRFFDASNYHFAHEYEIVGDFNWKTLADNYNEVCSSSQPLVQNP